MSISYAEFSVNPVPYVKTVFMQSDAQLFDSCMYTSCNKAAGKANPN